MLVLARRVGQSIIIDNNIELLVIEVRGDQVRLGFNAPRSVPIHRKELLEQITAQNLEVAKLSIESSEEINKQDKFIKKQIGQSP